MSKEFWQLIIFLAVYSFGMALPLLWFGNKYLRHIKDKALRQAAAYSITGLVVILGIILVSIFLPDNALDCITCKEGVCP